MYLLEVDEPSCSVSAFAERKLYSRFRRLFNFGFCFFFYTQGATVRKKQELHRLCEANRAYAHYRW